MKKKRPRCHNCKFASEPFKIVGKTHYHCLNREEYPESELINLSAWETVREFWETCKRHEFMDCELTSSAGQNNEV